MIREGERGRERWYTQEQCQLTTYSTLEVLERILQYSTTIL